MAALIERCIDDISLIAASILITLNIRDYKPSDFERLYEIDHLAFSEDIAYSKVELRLYLQSRRCRTFVAEEEDKVVGFAIARSESRKLGHLITIDVTPHRQRQSIGSRLLESAERWLWKNGAEAIYLETPVDDAGTKGFYEKHDYFLYETFEGYYNGTLDALVMMKTKGRSNI